MRMSYTQEACSTQKMTNPHLELFYFPQCPFCMMVLRTLKEHNLKVDLLNIREDENHYQRLLKDTGRTTVPCLYIDNKPLFESSDIISWLRENQGTLEKA